MTLKSKIKKEVGRAALIIAALTISLTGFSQESDGKNSPPILQKASIVNEKGDVELRWKLTDTIEASIKIIRYKKEGDNFVIIHSIEDTSTISWIDKNTQANKQTHAYRVLYDLESDIYPSNKFSTTLLTQTTDTCKQTVKLQWTRFVQHANYNPINPNDTIEVNRYNIWKSEAGGDYQKIETIEAPENASESDTIRIDTTYTDGDIEYNRDYSYYVEMVPKEDPYLPSKSNRVNFNVNMPAAPQYINIDSIISTSRAVRLSFTIDTASQLNEYLLLRSPNYQGPYDTVETFQTSSKKISYTDEAFNPRSQRYYYHLAAVNRCGNLSTRSDTLHNLLITLEKNHLSAKIGWSELTSFTNTPFNDVTYFVLRKVGGEMGYTQIISHEYPPIQDDEIADYKGNDVSSKFCYYVTAEVRQDNNLTTHIASFKRCIYIQPDLFIPNAIIPNDPNNNVFKPQLTFIPEKYLLIVYDRQGRKVFQTKAYDKGWKGRIRGGQKAPGGSYIYYLEIKNPGEPFIRKRGSVTVIYNR